MTNTSASVFVSLPELAESWRVSYEHMRNLVLRRELPAYRIMGRIIVSRDDADAYLERARTVRPETESQQPVAA
jgi:hypothetical protein